ncbi:Predicted arabinose efflux permease, MFS family [Pseudonocardia oroxyli]|uniref:Predicted arabinose efflux permease, MFS family n=2 Tax=Pseudonocardia oroxyli TaxID=366584 RepID=A0A1G7TVW3_PSEOR|nr:Predicted arabinose efflux permease, MFS family [Pseudonocardia oroxyli]
MTATDRLSARAWALLLVLSGAIFLEGVDISMMGVALPSMRADLALSTGELQWVVSSYVLGYGGFVLLGGRAADLLGRRRMFLVMLGVFVVFSGLGGVATEGWMLGAARFVTGVAAAFTAPAGLSIITTTYARGPARDRAVLVYAGAAAGGFSLGMVVGGLLTALHWRWVFFAPVVLATVILAAAAAVVPRDGGARRAGARFDLVGTLLLTVGMSLLILTVVHAPEVPLAISLLTGAGAVAGLVAFLAVERRRPEPLLRLGILRVPGVARANLGAMALVGSFMAFQFSAVLFLQEQLGWSSIETGLLLAIGGLDAVLAPTLAPPLVRRVGNGRVLVAGLGLAAVGYLGFLPLDGTVSLMAAGLLAISVAFALAYGPLTLVGTDRAEESEQGLAGGLMTMSFQFGGAIGLAVATAAVVSADLRAGIVVAVALAVAGVAVTAPLARHGAAEPAGVARAAR